MILQTKPLPVGRFFNILNAYNKQIIMTIDEWKYVWYTIHDLDPELAISLVYTKLDPFEHPENISKLYSVLEWDYLR